MPTTPNTVTYEQAAGTSGAWLARIDNKHVATVVFPGNGLWYVLGHPKTGYSYADDAVRASLALAEVKTELDEAKITISILKTLVSTGK